ncbi:MAG TPA: erythromycin esterase family protein [Rhodothermales bacterium]|nr:erythromycin esterase family protein [Rhodothermales bacterium]
MATLTDRFEDTVRIETDGVTLEGELIVPEGARGVVLFAHGSGSSRHSRRNKRVAERLRRSRLGTLLMDLLTPDEEAIDRYTAHLRFDIPMLARRLAGAVDWLDEEEATDGLPVGLFGASTGGGAAVIAATERPGRVLAVVSRGGRVDLAGDALHRIEAPTLLIVGGRDYQVIEMNEEAFAQVNAEKRMEIVPGASHLFEEPGALDQVADLAADWFEAHLAPGTTDVVHADSDVQHTEETVEERTEPIRAYRGPAELAALIGQTAEPFDAIETASLDALLDRIGDARVVLIGEASHGTSEFYQMRAQITRALIERNGFTIVSAEADWPDAEHIDEYVRGRAGKGERAWQAFDRFPSWMWRNMEVLEFIEWLRAYNENVDDERQAGFYGLDMYSMYTSIHEVLKYLGKVDPQLEQSARERYSCLLPFQADPALYGHAVISEHHRDCEAEAVEMLQDLLKERMRLSQQDGGRYFDAQQNAAVVKSAEEYYRIMYYGSPESWNLRDRHMFETLKAVLKFRGANSKAVVWAHNSHVGNAAATQMYARGEINIGYLSREEFGEGVYDIGFGTHTGTVAAATSWGGSVEFKQVRPSHRRSYERLCHDSGVPKFFLPLRQTADPNLRHELMDPRLERAIGVIYRPETELQSHYFGAVLPQQFDEYVWFDETEAVRPLGLSTAPTLPERHPFALLVD